MSENLPAERPETDLSERDLAKVKEFVAEGMPGLAKLGESDFHRMAEMYMHGSTYQQIQSSLKVPKALVYYLSHTYGWYPARREYLEEIQTKIKSRVSDSKLSSQDFLLLAIQAYQKKLGKRLQDYLASDDSAHADGINLKEIDKLIKLIETLQSLDSDNKKSGNKTPAIGLNVGDGATIERAGDNKLVITPTVNAQLGSILKKFADNRRAEEDKKLSDIGKNKPKNEEPNDEN